MKKDILPEQGIEDMWNKGSVLVRIAPDNHEMEVMNKGTFIELLKSLSPVGEVSDQDIIDETLSEDRYSVNEPEDAKLFIEGAKWMRDRMRSQALSSTEWVSVEDKPKEGQYVLIYGKGNRQFTALFQKGEFYAYNPFNEDLEDCEEITHWQPLPNPPKQ